jgi:hypothetical protein
MNANVERILLDPSFSNWLKDALRSALECDPIVVANEADVLRAVLMRRVAEGEGIDAIAVAS